MFEPAEVAKYHLNAIINLIKEKLSLDEQDEIYYHFQMVTQQLEE